MLLGKIKPYISFVVVGRNDNYGHRFLYRTQNFITRLEYLCNKYKLYAEIVFVEWNPPQGEKRLWEELKYSDKNEFLKLRFVEVPNNIHKTFQNSDQFQLFEYLGKNVGIKRSEGEFAVITNPDIIFSDDVIRFFSEKRLDKRFFYRIDRYDLFDDIPENAAQEEIEKYCQRRWKSAFGVYYRKFNLRHIRENFLKKIERYFINVIRLVFMIFSNKHKHLRYYGGAPGDFILMSKKAWERINGFPELHVRGGLDGYGVILARVSGLKMKVLRNPCRIYHQFHDRDDLRGIDLEKCNQTISEMLKTKKMINSNDENWGLADKRLKEKVIE